MIVLWAHVMCITLPQPLPFPEFETVDILLEVSVVGIVLNFMVKDTVVYKEMDTGVRTVGEVTNK